MTRVLEGLQPEKVFYYFEEISNIPRGSGNEKAISDYMVAFAKKHNLWVKQDEAYNIYMKKPATPGYEEAPAVIMQGHMDMVCEKNNDVEHDFEKEGIKLHIDDDFIRAKGTTLGADNGVAIAYQLAILADDTIEHPELYALMTTAEETGMDGVAHLHPEYIDAKVLINLDTDIEGEFLVSCAGGAKAHVSLPVNYEEKPTNLIGYKLSIKGLTGGHSGADIHLERANANILMGRLLDAVRGISAVQLVDLQGGSKDNVITREAEAVFYAEAHEKVENCVNEMLQNFKKEYEKQEPTLRGSLEKIEETKNCLTAETTQKVIDLMIMLPHGVMAYSMQIPGLVETSLNMGVVHLDSEKLKFVFAVRSSLPSKKDQILRKLEQVSHYVGAQYSVTGAYPAWVYESQSRIRELAEEMFEKQYHKKPEIKAIHAGLECGFLLEKMPGLDMIAFGPNAYDIHSPEERVSISSMARVYQYLLALLKSMKSY